MDYGIFNVHTDIKACDCTRRCTDTGRQSALKVDSGRKIPCLTGESNLLQHRAGPMLYQLSYIPSRVPLFHLCSYYSSLRRNLVADNCTSQTNYVVYHLFYTVVIGN